MINPEFSPSSSPASVTSAFAPDGFHSPDMDGNWVRFNDTTTDMFSPQSPMRGDGFLPAQYDNIMGNRCGGDASSEEEFGTENGKPSSFSFPTEPLAFAFSGSECPVCTQKLTCSSSMFHKHVTMCFNANHRRSKVTKLKNPSKSISQIKSFISKMDLRLRIGIMESFHRLGQISSTPNASPRSPSLSPKAEASDNYVLQLCYRIQKHRSLKHMRLPSSQGYSLPDAMGRARKGKSLARFASISRSDVQKAKEVGRDAIALADASFASEVSMFKPLNNQGGLKFPHYRQLFDDHAAVGKFAVSSGGNEMTTTNLDSFLLKSGGVDMSKALLDVDSHGLFLDEGGMAAGVSGKEHDEGSKIVSSFMKSAGDDVFSAAQVQVL